MTTIFGEAWEVLRLVWERAAPELAEIDPFWTNVAGPQTPRAFRLCVLVCPCCRRAPWRQPKCPWLLRESQALASPQSPWPFRTIPSAVDPRRSLGLGWR